MVFTLEGGDRPDAWNVMLVMSDGESDDPQVTLDEALKLKNKGVFIVAVGKCRPKGPCFGLYAPSQRLGHVTPETVSFRTKEHFVT